MIHSEKRSCLILSSELSFLFCFTSIVNEFEVCFCKVQTEYFSPRFCDQFKGKLAVFSLAKGWAVIAKEEKRFVSYQSDRENHV